MCVTDRAYNVLNYNDQFAQTFLSTAAARQAARRLNLMRALLLDPRTRKQTATSVEWVQELTAELVESVALSPADADLQQLHAEVAADSLVGPAYEDAPGYTYPDRQSKFLLSHTLPGLGLRQIILVWE